MSNGIINMLPPYYCLRQGAKYMGLRDLDKSYIVGFRSPVQARHVQYTMHPSADMKLQRVHPPMDLTSDMEAGLQQLSIRQTLRAPVLLEPAAQLIIPKAPVDMPSELQDGGYHLLTVPAEDFLTLPLTRHVGILVTTDIVEEDDTKIIMQCDVVDPQFDARLFGKM